MCYLGWKHVGEGFGLKWLLLYLSRSARIFLIHGPCMQNQPCVRKVKAMYASSSPHMHGTWKKPMFPCFEQSFSTPKHF